jgi:predicted AAA+ superfamily ATPase
MEPQLKGLVPRRLEQVIQGLMTEEPVVILQGPRAVGKSTLLRRLGEEAGAPIIDLDDLATRDALAADPGRFANGPSPVLIDEIQHVPEVLDAIKAELNRDLRPGRFVITGSTNYAALPDAARRLTGRAHTVNVLPLSQGEIAQHEETFVATLIERPEALLGANSSTSRDAYVARAIAGGYPIALSRTPSGRARWFDDYVRQVIERDVVELSKIRQRQLLPRLLAQLASQTGQLLNVHRAASRIGMDPSTAENYTKLLEAVFLIRRLPAWGTTLGSRVGAAPKVHVVDPGLAAHLLRLTESKLAAKSAPAQTEFGHLLETFVAGEMFKQIGWVDGVREFGHWRTRDGDEVDLVIERGDGKVAAVEVKAGARVTNGDLDPLRKLRARLGDSFLGGVCLYTGELSYGHDDRIYVVPVDALWR